MYSKEFKERVIKYRIEKHHTIEGTSKTYEIGTTTVKRWVKEYQINGSIRSEYDSSTRKYKKINPEELKKYIKENNDKYLKEIAEIFSCSIAGIKYVMKKLKITRKKRQKVTEKEMK